MMWWSTRLLEYACGRCRKVHRLGMDAAWESEERWSEPHTDVGTPPDSTSLLATFSQTIIIDTG